MGESSSNIAAGSDGPRVPPARLSGVLRHLGPGLIIAGSIVGSGELIATTKTGSEAGFYLLWLIIIGCLIKVFSQVEFGRFTIVTGKTALEGMNMVPGPRWRVNWIIWYWLIMFLVSIAQLGGIVGGVGQALAISAPLTASGRAFNEYQDLQVRREVDRALKTEGRLESGRSSGRSSETMQGERESSAVPPESRDDIWWAVLVSLMTSVMLVIGRYRLVQALSTALVAGFTAVTIVNVIQLQSLPEWRVTWDELMLGFSFQLPPADSVGGSVALSTALATLGIIGVGATELVQYPYWCKEKGYARWTGQRDGSTEWVKRARGWLRVLQWDAWCSAVVYTFATAAFYLLGAAILGRVGLNPGGTQMVRTLSEMYTPVFGSIAQAVFLAGALAVLYSTFFVANAGHARVCADALRVFGLTTDDPGTLRRWERIFSGLFPLVCLLIYMVARSPVKLVLASGVMQAIMLPMLGASAVYFRYRQGDRRLAPGLLWDLFLWLSALGLLIAGGYLAVSKIWPGIG